LHVNIQSTASTNSFDLIHDLAKNSRKDGYLDKIKEYIQRYPENINLQDELGWTPLMIACQNSNTTSNLECVELLLKNNANPNLKNNFGTTAFIKASCYSKTVKLLLENDVYSNLLDNKGKNPCNGLFEEHPELLKEKECNKDEIILKITELPKSL